MCHFPSSLLSCRLKRLVTTSQASGCNAWLAGRARKLASLACAGLICGVLANSAGADFLVAGYPPGQWGVADTALDLAEVSFVRIIGEPTTPDEAATLAEEDKYQFQWWALGLVGARPFEQKTNRQKYPRLQLRTVKELMEGQGIERPTSAASLDATFKKAPQSKAKRPAQDELTL